MLSYYSEHSFMEKPRIDNRLPQSATLVWDYVTKIHSAAFGNKTILHVLIYYHP